MLKQLIGILLHDTITEFLFKTSLFEPGLRLTLGITYGTNVQSLLSTDSEDSSVSGKESKVTCSCTPPNAGLIKKTI